MSLWHEFRMQTTINHVKAWFIVVMTFLDWDGITPHYEIYILFYKSGNHCCSYLLSKAIER